MAGCECSGDSCKCAELEKRVEELQGEVAAYKDALERLSEHRGRRSGLHYGSDGFRDIRLIAREALSPPRP